MDKMRTDEELKQIAKDIYAGRIFTDRQIDREENIMSVFMALVFLGCPITDSDVEKLESLTLAKKVQHEAALIFEYMDKAGPVSVNGMPTFLSFQYLTRDELKKMNGYYGKIVEAMKEI